MSDVAVQASFNSGEWSPTLYARVDLQKYRSGAALLENFFVDYRGGASSRSGTEYILQAYKSNSQVRLIPFQASFNVGYILEFGNGYIRFYFDGSPVLENPVSISNISQSNPCIVTASSSYLVGDWIYIDQVVGMTQVNGRYFRVNAVAGSSITLGDLNGSPIDSTGYSAYVSGGRTRRVYTIASPYTSADDLRLIKFSQSVSEMILCHPSHPTQALVLITATNWSINPITIGTTTAPPGNVYTASTLGSGSVSYSYGVTTIDENGQESVMSNPASLTGIADIRSVAGTNEITWDGVAGGASYRVYEANVSYFGVVPYGVTYGYIGEVGGLALNDSNISPDFTQTPPIAKNPFAGSGINEVVMTGNGIYTSVPTVVVGGSPTIAPTLQAILQARATPAITAGGSGFNIGDTVGFSYGIVMRVTGVTTGAITSWVFASRGQVTSGSPSLGAQAQTYTSGSGTGAQLTATWEVGQTVVVNPGAGFNSAPPISYSPAVGTPATAYAVLGDVSNGYPTVPGFYQQRLVLAGQVGSPQSFYMSQPGAYFNFNISNPTKATDAISGTLVSGVLNSIKSMVSIPSGILMLTDKGSWVINGGTAGAAVTPSNIVANAQSFIGANDVPPIVANYDILYVSSKGSNVRDLAYNIYFNTFTGTDISVLSSHLFYGHELVEWAWAEQPFYTVWAVRDDGVMLTLTFLKEQEFIGWAHQVTSGNFLSVASVTETTDVAGTVDAVYTVVERVVNGITVQYIERVSERVFPSGVADAWCVDSGLRYVGSPATTFYGAEHLAGLTCTGLADGVIIPPFVMPANGSFTLATPASKVVVGLPFTAKLQTLALDVGEPSVQGKVKKITAVDVRVADTLGLDIGNDFDHLTAMKDLIVGNVGSMLTGQASQVVTGLFTGDARTQIGPAYTVPGQYCIQQSKPYPASVLGVFPIVVQGDSR